MSPGGTPVRDAVEDAHRREWASVLAATVRVTRDLDLAEECVQDAYAAALTEWARGGVPRRPGAWLTTAARHNALDALRRARTLRSKLHLLIEPESGTGTGTESETGTEPGNGWNPGAQPEPRIGTETGTERDPGTGPEPRIGSGAGPEARRAAVSDDRLRLVFLCCHPALAPAARIALTLRLVCGVPTADVARAFLVPEPTMAARITRAKKKIVAARIPFRMPAPDELPNRLDPVLATIHLLFTTGHTAPTGPALTRDDIAERALDLARTLYALLPDEREVRGLLALLLASHARRATRTTPAGRPSLLEAQDRTTWDRDAVAEAHRLVVGALRGGSPGRYGLQAAIASLHASAPTYAETDWAQILVLYDALLVIWPSPVVALNRAVAVAVVDGPATGLAEVEALEQDGRLAAYHYLPAVKADLLRRLGRSQDAAVAYERAIALADNDAERAFLADRLAETGRRD